MTHVSFFLLFIYKFPKGCGSFFAWPLTGLYGKELEELKAHVCAGTPWLPSSCEYINSFATLRLPNPNICHCTFFNIYDDESKYCLLDWVTQKGQALGLAGGGRRECCWCLNVNVSLLSPESARPHHRGNAHRLVWLQTCVQTWRSSANNLHEFEYCGFMSLNFNSSCKDSGVDERMVKCVHGFACLESADLSYTPASRCVCVEIYCTSIWAFPCIARARVAMRWSIRGDIFMSWSQIWISSDEVLFPLDQLPSLQDSGSEAAWLNGAYLMSLELQPNRSRLKL